MSGGGGSGDDGRPVSEGGHIILVGLPGAGKSTVGAAVAARLGRPFLDFDVELERREGMSVERIFADRGEGHFRRLERELTADLRGEPPMVLAPGGGWVTNAGVVALLRPPGRIIYLRVDPATALRRLGSAADRRPLLRVPDPHDRLSRLLAEREAAYLAADHVVEAQDIEFSALVSLVTELASVSGRT